MFDRLATSLNIAFKWFPMFDQVETFFIQHFALQTDVWSFSHFVTQSLREQEKATNRKRYFMLVAS